MAVLLWSLCTSSALAGAVVPGDRIVGEAAHSLFGVDVPTGWATTFRPRDVSVPGTNWRLAATNRTVGERVRMAIVTVEVDGRVVRRVPVVFNLRSAAGVLRSDSPSSPGEEAVVHRGDPVSVVARRGSVQIEVGGEALREGRVGERIKVRCGRNVVDARVTGASAVEVVRR